MQTIATFFAGIMALFSSLLGNTTTPEPPKVEPVVITSPTSTTSVVQEVASTTQPATQATTTQNLKTYRNELYGYEIQYPSKWEVTYDKGRIHIHDQSTKNQDNEPETILSITEESADSIREFTDFHFI
jgi:hypothetical protein